METKSIRLFIVICVNLLNFSYSFGKFENISDCKYGPPNPNAHIVLPYELTIICGKTDNTSNIFHPTEDGILCSNTEGYIAPRYRDIRRIKFENCLLRDINNDYFKDFTQLTEFDISDVNLTTITIEKLPQSPLLAVFNASQNQLISFPSNLFTGIRGLRTLDVSYNAINQINSSDFLDADNLRTLIMSHNHLLEIPLHSFTEAKKLLSFDVSANKIERLQHGAFIGVASLESLILSDNPIGNLKADTFAYLPNLEHLDLKRTNISSIALGTFSFQSKLISLDLSENKLKGINFDVFLPGLQHLESLRLAGNQLQELYGFENAMFPELSLLDIKNNQFTCEYLKRFMRSINWNKIDFLVDPNAIDPQKTNIRGINCETSYYSVIGTNDV